PPTLCSAPPMRPPARSAWGGALRAGPALDVVCVCDESARFPGGPRTRPPITCVRQRLSCTAYPHMRSFHVAVRGRGAPSRGLFPGPGRRVSALRRDRCGPERGKMEGTSRRVVDETGAREENTRTRGRATSVVARTWVR